jgi:hypothetical protein
MDGVVERLRDEIGDGLLAVSLGDVRSLEFEPTYVREDAGETWEHLEEFFSDETQRDIFESIAAERFFETGEKDARSPLGRLRFTDRIYEEAIIVLGWLDSNTVVVTLDPDVDLVSPTVAVLEEALEGGAVEG